MRISVPSSTGHMHFLRNAMSMPLLTAEKESELALRWKEEGNQYAASQLIQSHMKLVIKIARRYKGYGFCEQDIIAEGNIGLMHAVKNFDPARGYRFSTYAMWWVKAQIQEYILKNWSLVKLGTTALQKKLFFSLNKIQRQIENSEISVELKYQDAEQMCGQFGTSPCEIINIHHRISSRDMSLNAFVSNENSNEEKISFLVDDKETAEAIIIQKNETRYRRAIFVEAFKQLNTREQIILTQRRLQEHTITLEELSQKLNISRERVRQVENEAFIKLQRIVKKTTK